MDSSIDNLSVGNTKFVRVNSKFKKEEKNGIYKFRKF